MDVLQIAIFTSIVESAKVMSLISHTCFELKSLDYGAIIIEFVNCLPTKFNGDMLFGYTPKSPPTVFVCKAYEVLRT
jgi:hypothetical protein